MQIDEIQKLLKANQCVWTEHVSERMEQRNIVKEDVIRGILSGEIIEEYPDSYPFPSCLIWARLMNDKIIHIVVGCDQKSIYIISVYIPNELKFEKEFKIRRKK